MKFEYIGPNAIENVDGNLVEVPANCYGGAKVSRGYKIELDGFLADKAMNNPNYRLIKPGPKPRPKKVVEEVAEDMPEEIKELTE